MKTFLEWLNPDDIYFTSFTRNGQVKVTANGKKHIFIIDGLYVDQIKNSSDKDPIGTFNKLKSWVEKGLAQEI